MERNKEIEIDTRLGRRCVSTDKIVSFPRGLAGFENERDFVLLQIRPDAPLLILQSVSTPLVGLLVADPYSFVDRSAFTPVLGPAEKQLLQLGDLEQAAVLVTVSIPRGAPEQAALNLTGPIVINHEARIGLQVPQNLEGPQQLYMNTLQPVEKSPAEPQQEQPAPDAAAKAPSR